MPGAVETGGGGPSVVDASGAGGGAVVEVLLVAIGGIGGGVTVLLLSPPVSLAIFPSPGALPVKSVFFVLYREFTFKLSKIKDKMLTDEGKKIALERHEFMANFFNRLSEEVKGDL